MQFVPQPGGAAAVTPPRRFARRARAFGEPCRNKKAFRSPGDSSMSGRRYVLITPCRDEALFARRTLDSVAAQTVPPALWVIVDDGSKDETPQILDEYAARFPYIRVIRRPDRGQRVLGSGVIDAFYAGYNASINPDDFDY